jgi:hypothetical protein
VGWNRLCQGAAAVGAERGRFWGSTGSLCGAAVAAGKLKVAGAAPGVWIRAADTQASGGPVLAFQDGLSVDVEEAWQKGDKLVARGQAYAASAGDRRPWSVEIQTKEALADRDGDGVPDRTETFLGTNPAAKDSDGDGKDDGDDPSPLAKPAARAGDKELVEEIVRYALLEQPPPVRVVYVYAAAAQRSELDGVAGVVLHRDLMPRTAHELPVQAVPGAAHVILDEVTVNGETATALVRTLEAGHHGSWVGPPSRLTLRHLGKTWRVSAAAVEGTKD